MVVKNKPTTWSSQSGYIWAMIGSAVGLANILGFSSKCYMNGGAAFLIPLFVALIVLGLPLLILEGVIGNSFCAPLVTASRKVLGRWGAFLSWPTILGVFTIGTYYTVINAWTLAYTYFSSRGAIPSDTESFFFQDLLQISSGLFDFTGFSSITFGCGVLICGVVYWINLKSVDQGIERLNGIFLPVLSVLLVLMLAFTMSLPGAMDGLALFLVPEWSSLYDPKIWLNSFGHVFFSLSVGLGVIVGYSKYADKQVDILKSMKYVILGDLLTSFVAGAMIFGGLGYMAQSVGQPVKDIITSSIFGTGFIVIPKICQSVGGIAGMFLGVMFFACLLIAGLSSQVSIVETVVGNFQEEFGLKRSRAVAIVVATMFLGVVLCSFGNGLHLIGVIDSMTAGFNVLISAFVQIVIFAYISKKTLSWKGWYRYGRPTLLFWMLRYVAPVAIAAILVTAIYNDMDSFAQPEWFLRWGWFISAVFLSWCFSFVKLGARSQETADQ